MTEEPLLSVRDLHVALGSGLKTPILRGIDLTIDRSSTVALVGESGSGKSTTALAIMGLLPPLMAVTHGSIIFAGVDIVRCTRHELQAIRGRKIALVLQEPMSALNPVVTIGDQIGEPLRVHEGASKHEARRRTIELLELVRLPGAARLVDAYPHRLSGGQRQRVVIAAAIACKPTLLIADEPTTALDVTIQAQILALLRTLQNELGLAVLLITHNLGIVAEMADRVMVMYAGRVVEEAAAATLYAAPLHPYTRGLLAATPYPGRVSATRRLPDIPGLVPTMDALPSGCAFAPRCSAVIDACALAAPSLEPRSAPHRAACIHVSATTE